MMTPRSYLLAEATWASVRRTHFEVAVLPWGATEAHNTHLPYGTDTVLTAWIAAESARRAWDSGARVVVLPAVRFGVNTGQLDIPLTINMNPSTQAAVLADIVASLAGHGVAKLVICNGHGGNDFRQMLRELQPRYQRPFLCTMNCYRAVDPDAYFLPGDHAGEMETSIMLHVAPALVRPLAEAGAGAAKRFRIRGLREGWAWAPRAWTRVTEDTGVGDPRGATAERGKAYAEAVVERFATFLQELAAADLEDMYETRDEG